MAELPCDEHIVRLIVESKPVFQRYRFAGRICGDIKSSPFTF